MGVDLGPLGGEVPRSHAMALMVSAGALLALGFALGFAAGTWMAEGEGDGAPTFGEAVPGRDLVALLAEIERFDKVTTSDEMKYPELLQRREAIEVPTEAPAPPTVRAELLPSDVGVNFQADPTPPGTHTVELGRFSEEKQAAILREHLRTRGQAVWWRLERVDGAPVWVVAVGGFNGQAAAEAAVPEAAAAAAGSQVAGVSAKVVPLPRR